jgi:hypothetical protein
MSSPWYDSRGIASVSKENKVDSEAHVPADWRNPDLKLYHGTIRAYAESIALKGVDLGLARNDSDFGRGFYTTTLWRQAAEWARYRYVRLSENEQADPAYAPAVVAYSVQREALAGMDALGGRGPGRGRTGRRA